MAIVAFKEHQFKFASDKILKKVDLDDYIPEAPKPKKKAQPVIVRQQQRSFLDLEPLELKPYEYV